MREEITNDIHPTRKNEPHKYNKQT